jgi:hypothetical protein
MASASPNASMAMVEAVGVKSIGQASFHADVERHLGRLRQSGFQVARQRQDGNTESFGGGQKVVDLGGVAAVAQRHQQVALDQHAEVAVRCLGGMEEERRRAGGSKRRGDLLPDDARLPNAGDDDAPLAGKDQLDGLLEALVEPLQQAFNGLQLRLQDFLGYLKTHGESLSLPQPFVNRSVAE